jgi:CheY-like chemotaxis protein
MPRILIVEDNFDNLTLVRLLLEREGYQVVVALDGEEGLDLVHSEKPDLIALDLDMPVMDGWELLKQLKMDSETQDIPVVVVTAHLLPGERNRVLKAGGAGYVSKPFKVNDIVNEIQRCLNA